MKFMKKFMSACALLVAVVNCYGAEQVGHKQKIYIKNKTSGVIHGGVYATSATGEVLMSNLVGNMDKSMAAGACRVIEIFKPKEKKSTQFHRLIFAKDSLNERGAQVSAQDAIKAKVDSNDGTNVSSTTIKWFSGAQPLYYEIHDDKSLVTRKPKLKFKKVSPFKCNAAIELWGNAQGIFSEGVQDLAKIFS